MKFEPKDIYCEALCNDYSDWLMQEMHENF